MVIPCLGQRGQHPCLFLYVTRHLLSSSEPTGRAAAPRPRQTFARGPVRLGCSRPGPFLGKAAPRPPAHCSVSAARGRPVPRGCGPPAEDVRDRGRGLQADQHGPPVCHRVPRCQRRGEDPLGDREAVSVSGAALACARASELPRARRWEGEALTRWTTLGDRALLSPGALPVVCVLRLSRQRLSFWSTCRWLWASAPRLGTRVLGPARVEVRV